MSLPTAAFHMARRAVAVRTISAAIGIGMGIGVAAALFAVPALRAQESVAGASATLDGLTDAKSRAAVRALLEDAAAKGIPTAPLVTKVREGLAKRAAPERIHAATAALATRLASAATALAPARSTEEIAAGADVLQTGVTERALREMRTIWPAKPLTVPLGVLAELVASGVPPGNATQRVRELLVRGATTAQIATLGTSVRADVAAGLAPDAAMELRSKGVLLQLPNASSLPAISSPIRPPIRP